MVNRRKQLYKSLSVIAAVALLLGWIVIPFGSGQAATSSSIVLDPEVLDIGVELRALDPDDIPLDRSEFKKHMENQQSASNVLAMQQEEQYQIGDQKWLVALDQYMNRYYLKSFTLRSAGDYGEIWVADNLTFPEGDPRNDKVNITQEQADYLLSEFEQRMYPQEVDFFGQPDFLNGENSLLEQWGIEDLYSEQGRVMILIDNVRDESYYDPTYPHYVAGFYSPTIELYTNRNVMTIDAYDWLNRTGENAAHPFLYESVFAHEFQHLLHDDYDSDEDSWVNEGMSDFAEFLVGYGHPASHVNFFLEHPENSLIAWEDQGNREVLADYGFAYLFQLYLYEQFGPDFIKDLFHEQNNSIAGVNHVLDQNDYDMEFKTLYRNFITAVLLDGKYRGDNGTYQFNSIDLQPAIDSEEAYSHPGAPAWGTDFIKIDPTVKVDRLLLNGIDFFKTPWQAVADPLGERETVLWGNNGNLVDNHLIMELDLTGIENASAATLAFDTYYVIEEAWDYGFVQVSTDNGETWTSLANEHTQSVLDPHGHPNIAANLPGFTGSSNGWVTETFDLSPYAGQNVLLSFRHMTDWAYNDIGWYVDNIRVEEIGYFEPADSTELFKSIEQVRQQYTDYLVSFVGVKKGNHGMAKVVHVDNLLNFTEGTAKEIQEMLNDASYDYIVMMITHASKQNNANYVDYDYEIVEHQTGPKK